MLRASFVIAFVIAAATTGCRQLPTRDAGRSARGTGKPGETRARSRATPRPSTTPCKYTPLRSVGTQVNATGEMTMAFVSGHLGLAWTAANNAPSGTELRDNGAILRPMSASEFAPAHDGMAVLWSRPFPMLDPRAALAASIDIERQVDEADPDSEHEAGSHVELRCGEVVDTPFFVTHAGNESANPGSMFACRSVGDAQPYVIGLATDRSGQAVRVFARRSPLPVAAAWDADRFADAVWAIPLEPTTGTETSEVIRSWRDAYEPGALTAVDAPGRRSLLALVEQGRLYFGWLDARLAAASPLHRVPNATHVSGAAVAWNGYEALLVYTEVENGTERVMASRVGARSGASAPVQIATAAAVSHAFRSPSVAAFGSGEWAVAWIEANRMSDNALPGIARLQVLRTDLTPREAVHGWGGDQVAQVQVASRGESAVIAVLAGSDGSAHVDVGSARCASAGYVPPPATIPASEAMPPITASTPQSPIDGGTTCTAFPRRAFHLRAAPARASTGRELPRIPSTPCRRSPPTPLRTTRPRSCPRYRWPPRSRASTPFRNRAVIRIRRGVRFASVPGHRGARGIGALAPRALEGLVRCASRPSLRSATETVR
jgi:hypothetical protein